jgi:hypothetical protein
MKRKSRRNCRTWKTGRRIKENEDERKERERR